MQVLERPVRYWYRKTGLAKRLAAGNNPVKRNLELLHPGQSGEELLEEYYCKKTVRSLAICLVGILLGAAVQISNVLGDTLKDGYVLRGDYDEELTKWNLTAALSDGETKQFSVDVSPRELTDEECKELLAEFLNELPGFILQGAEGQGNQSLDYVTVDLNLTERYGEYPFTVEWRSDQPSVLAGTGEVFAVEEAVSVTLRALITYGNRSWEELLDVVVTPKELTAKEQFAKGLEALLEESERSGRQTDRWQLPDNFQGKELKWQSKKDNTGVMLAMGAFGAALLIFVMADKDLHDELLKKRKGYKARYPGLVRKLTLYLGAGLAMRAAFQRLAGEYEEEIGYVCRQLHAGVSEAVAYEQLGKRTGVQEYVRLSALLTQNLKKGNDDLLKRLREETARAEAEKVQTCKKLAEEASTKLLVPMVLFLVVVMVMVMLPAFFSVEM